MYPSGYDVPSLSKATDLMFGDTYICGKRIMWIKDLKKSQNIWIANIVCRQGRKGEEIKVGWGDMPKFPMMLNGVLCNIDT